jgi:hypothetical protein
MTLPLQSHNILVLKNRKDPDPGNPKIMELSTVDLYPEHCQVVIYEDCCLADDRYLASVANNIIILWDQVPTGS